jgi:putative two-component system response regulator
LNTIGGSIIRHRILVVDDEVDNVEMLERFLSEEASSIKSVTESNEVERVFIEFEPDIMLLDLHMPKPDGLEILRNLRSVRESLGFLPVIVLTGDTGRTARNSALLLGADDFLTKPLDRQEVVLRVRNLLRTRRLYVELDEANRALELKQKLR